MSPGPVSGPDVLARRFACKCPLLRRPPRVPLGAAATWRACPQVHPPLASRGRPGTLGLRSLRSPASRLRAPEGGGGSAALGLVLGLRPERLQPSDGERAASWRETRVLTPGAGGRVLPAGAPRAARRLPPATGPPRRPRLPPRGARSSSVGRRRRPASPGADGPDAPPRAHLAQPTAARPLVSGFSFGSHSETRRLHLVPEW